MWLCREKIMLIVVVVVMKMICVCWFLKIQRGVIGQKFEKCTPEKLICHLQCKIGHLIFVDETVTYTFSFSAFLPKLQSHVLPRSEQQTSSTPSTSVSKYRRFQNTRAVLRIFGTRGSRPCFLSTTFS